MVGLLALIASQDVEPGEEEGTWRIAKKVAKDRVISTVDTEARHGHKSTAVRTDGFKAHLASEPDTGIVTAVKVTPANAPDGPVGIELMGDEPDGLEVLADSAYGSGAVRTALKKRHHRLVVKPLPSHPVFPGGFVHDEFSVDHADRAPSPAQRATWPACLRAASQSSPRTVQTARSARAARRPRLARSQFPSTTRSSSPQEHWARPDIRAAYRLHRPMAERSISWLVAKGNRRLRYRGGRARRGLAPPPRRGAQLAQARRSRAHEA